MNGITHTTNFARSNFPIPLTRNPVTCDQPGFSIHNYFNVLNSPGLTAPFSVIMAEINSAGVTSKAGL